MRIRSTKPEFWRSKTIAALPWDVRLVLKGLESYVDDNGVGKDDIALIASDVFPRDLSGSPTETLARLTEAISLLHQRGLVARYVVGGEELLYIDRWKDLQRIDKPGKGRFPRPDGSFEYAEEVIRESYGSPPEVVAPVTGEQGSKEQGNRGAVEQAKAAPRSKSESSLPDHWEPSPAAFQYAVEQQIDIGHEVGQFRAHAAANDRRQKDWDAAFRMWLGNAKKFSHLPDKPRITAAQRNLATVAHFEQQQMEIES